MMRFVGVTPLVTLLGILLVGSDNAKAADRLGDAACSSLNGLAIDSVGVGLPIRSAKVASAVMMSSVLAGNGPQGQPSTATPAYCKVLGSIAPIDPSAPAINFQINLPIVWNGKAVQYGGGGLNGVLISGLDSLRDAPPNTPTPLAQGYVTLGNDSGHQASALPEIHAFGLNEEALTNYAYAAYKKVHDVAAIVLRAAYGVGTSKFYYFGGSEGGREGLMMAQRFPEDYDGIVSVVPGTDFIGLMMKQTHLGLLQQDGGWLSPNKLATLQRAELAACDELDGLKDGVVSNIQACSKTFNPRALRCEGGQNVSDACLSDAEITVIEAIHAPYEYGFALSNGITSYPSFGYGGETQPGGMIAQITGVKQPTFPPLSQSEQGGLWFLGNGVVRYFIAGDAKFDPSKFKPEAFAARIRKLSELLNATNPDLSAFKKRGGKLILRSNLADYAVGPFGLFDYYTAVVDLMGRDAVDQFVRFYVSPGSAHPGTAFSGIDSAPVPTQADLLSALDNWVDKGQPPGDKLIQTLHTKDAPFSVLASRPMCSYPAYPHYLGTGNPKTADSYECRKP
jgi:feruloyl esterase